MEKTKSFEKDIKELEQIVKELELGEVDLEDAVKKFTKASQLAADAQKKLKTAEKAVNKILNTDGKLEKLELES